MCALLLPAGVRPVLGTDAYQPVGSGTGDAIEMRALPLSSTSTAAAGRSSISSVDAFPVTVKQLQDLVDPKSKKKLQELGGIVGVVNKLRTDPRRGLSTQEVDTTKDASGVEHSEVFGSRRAQFGANRLPPAESTPFYMLVWEALQDKTLIILIVAAFISIGIGIYDEVHNNKLIKEAEESGSPPPPTELGHWVEGVAILVAVIVVTLVNSVNDYSKEKQFRRLNSRKEDREVNVVRDGEQCQISVFDLVVGDVCAVAYGDVLPADGLLLDGRSIRCDESGMTGESDAIKKDLLEDPFLLSGTKVLEGQGTMVVIGVGENSLNGKTLMALRTEAEDTPLQVKLGELAESA